MQKYIHILYSFVFIIVLIAVEFDCITAQCLVDEHSDIMGSDTQANDYFGYSVDIYKNKAVVGAYLDDDNGSNSGSIYVLRIEDGSWIQEAKILPSDGKTNDWFGWSVAISGNTVVAGANRDNKAGDWTGSAYVFKYDGNSWVEEQILLADGTGYYWEEFGFDAAISADSNTILVGACKANDNGFKSGAAYVFRFDGTGWFQQAKLLAHDGVELATFGNSVAVSDDGNTAFIGAPGYDSKGRTAGSVYVFKYKNGEWSETQKLIASDATHGDHFGQNIAASGKYAVIGAYGDDNAEPNDVYCNSGSAYVFGYNGDKWTEQAKLQLPCGQCLNQFGWSVDVYSNKVIVGAPDGHWGIVNGTGHAYLFVYNGKRWIQSTEYMPESVMFGDHFGWSVAISDEAIVVGAELSDANGIDSGIVYIFNSNMISGDFDCSNNLDYIDFNIFAKAWLTKYGDENWNPVCDINIQADDIIDFSDLAVFAESWNKNHN
jgi:hypothetical protein